MIFKTLVHHALLITALSGLQVSAHSVSVELVQDYGDSYQAKVTLTNDTTSALDSWLVLLQLDGTLDDSWRCIYQASESFPSSYQYAFSNESYNGDIEPGASESFNFVVVTAAEPVLPVVGLVTANWQPVSDPRLRVGDITFTQ
jgi:hypothetical protein